MQVILEDSVVLPRQASGAAEKLEAPILSIGSRALGCRVKGLFIGFRAGFSINLTMDPEA